MDEEIRVNLARVKEIIFTFDIGSKFSTADIIEKYSGTFTSNINTPAYYSFNAQFGKLLKRSEKFLEISEVGANQPTKDCHGHDTTTSIWRRDI